MSNKLSCLLMTVQGDCRSSRLTLSVIVGFGK